MFDNVILVVFVVSHVDSHSHNIPFSLISQSQCQNICAYVSTLLLIQRQRILTKRFERTFGFLLTNLLRVVDELTIV